MTNKAKIRAVSYGIGRWSIAIQRTYDRNVKGARRRRNDRNEARAKRQCDAISLEAIST